MNLNKQHFEELNEILARIEVLIVTEVDANGREIRSHLPLTDDKAFRIYKTECLND